MTILIFAETIRELTQLTHQVLQRIQDLDLFLRLVKCLFNQTSVEYCHRQATVSHHFQIGFRILTPVWLVPLRTYRLKRLSQVIT
jgi:hypothetical protein